MMALDYAARGWHVLPLHNLVAGACSCASTDCKSPGKHPRTEHGVKDASNDPAIIAAWLAKWPDMNVGIATGPSGLLVVDVDPRHGGEDSLKALLKRHGEAIMATPRVKTGGGGLHVYYDRRGLELGNSVGHLGAGIDTRGVGGYVVAPPSLHASGKHYEWAKDASADAKLLPITEELVADLQRAKARATRTVNVQQQVEDGRNDYLTREAGRLWSRGTTRDALSAFLSEQNRTICKPPLPQREVDQIIRSITNYPQGDLPNVVVDAGENDVANARRLVALWGHLFRWVKEWEYVLWDGKRWNRDVAGTMEGFAKKTAAAMQACVPTITDDEKRKRMIRHANNSNGRGRIDAMVALAHSEAGIAKRPDDFDTHDDHLNVANGILDLRDGALHPHDPDHYFTSLVDIPFDATARCPRWDAFLLECCLGNADLAAYLQRCVGYTLTGRSGEHALFFLFGDGSNGKSTFLNTIQKLLGEDLSVALGMEALLSSRDAKTSQELASLVGKRMAVAIEVAEGRSFNEELIKAATGGEHRLQAKRLYQDAFTFKQRAKIWLAANDRPLIRGTNKGIWRRLHLVPFQNHVPKHKAIKDLDLLFEPELPGILAWAVRGSIDWHQRGLLVPDIVRQAVEEYREENDVVGAWAEAECTVRNDLATSSTQLLQAYNAYADANNEKQLTPQGFGRRLTAFRGGVLKREKVGHGIIQWRGIGLGRNVPEATQKTLGGDDDLRAELEAASRSAATGSEHEVVLGVVRDLCRSHPAVPFAKTLDVVAGALLLGIAEAQVPAILERLARNGAVYPKMGPDTWAPMAP